jgi:hypothetical protein
MFVIVEASKVEEVQRSIPGAWRIGDIVPRSGEARVVLH